ncbi:MAG: cytochrome c-type biogenesis protein CcmH [Acidimicrobiia bacterium]|nr:cytochrome c-type biogenesis protein CcmH [Acidimicrobiia bacterium]
MKSRRVIAWAALGTVVLVALAWAAWPSGDAATDRERVQDIASNLRCPDCEALSVAESATPTARAIRRDISKRVAAGESDDAIQAVYVERYGESTLLEPAGSGLGVIVWGLPVAALIAAGAGLVFASRRWRREAPMHATKADEALVDKARHE